MSANDSAPGLSACLTDREMEILRLLVAGHTVKTIAGRLGRSETSINERLRTARRKTGVGSSRELARLLDLQKIGDEKIDLSDRSIRADDLTHTATTWVRGRKGMISMLIAIPIAAAGLIFAAVPSGTQVEPPQAASSAVSRPLPLIGSWSLNATGIPEKERPQRVTIAFRTSEDGRWTSRVEIVAPDGSSRHAESTAALDGVPVPVTGNMDFIDSVALRQPAPDTLVMTLGKAGSRVSTRVYTVAKDLKSMTETIVWSSDSRQKLETTHFDRTD
ncbi:MAG: helix-turn-helix transcriptional regulator [Sphingopyxis sp.]|uniref:helix-turn-helix domain-containing protein n=1 Tax=Sphingopyxis sp. TaxID=1908224 RepID=UPI003D8104EF